MVIPIIVEFALRYRETPPPDWRLLYLHAICARAARMSGTAAFIEQLFRDAEESEVPASDESFGNLMSHPWNLPRLRSLSFPSPA